MFFFYKSFSSSHIPLPYLLHLLFTSSLSHSSQMPAGVSMAQYCKFTLAAMISMFAGSQTIHLIYRPLDVSSDKRTSILDFNLLLLHLNNNQLTTLVVLTTTFSCVLTTTFSCVLTTTFSCCVLTTTFSCENINENIYHNLYIYLFIFYIYLYYNLVKL